MTASLKHAPGDPAYSFYGDAPVRRTHCEISGMHVYARTKVPVKITRRQTAGAFEERFMVHCRDPKVFDVIRKSEPLQALIEKIFTDNVTRAALNEATVNVSFSPALAGRIRGRRRRIQVMSPADREWAMTVARRSQKLSLAVNLIIAEADRKKWLTPLVKKLKSSGPLAWAFGAE